MDSWSSMQLLVEGVDLLFIYIYIYIYTYIYTWVWLGWYFVWSSWKWATVKAHITGFFFLIWADGYTYLKKSFCWGGKCTFFFWQFQIQTLDLLDFGGKELLFWPCCVLSHNSSIKQEGKQKTKNKKLALACLTYETPWSGLIGWGWVPCMSMPVIFIISKYIKNYNSVQVITEPQSSRNFLLDIKKFLLVKFLSFFFEAPCYLKKNLCKIFVKFCFTRFYLKLFFARLLYFCMNVFFIGIT